jgi:hypothetical protein
LNVNSVGRSVLRCGKERVSIFFGAAAQYIEVDASNGKLTRIIKTILLLAVISNPVYAQAGTPVSNHYSHGAIPYGAILGVQDAVVLGQPYSAEINARKVRRQPDGKSLIYESHGSVVRDSEGRVRREQFQSPKVARPDGGRTYTQFAVVIPTLWQRCNSDGADVRLTLFDCPSIRHPAEDREF